MTPDVNFFCSFFFSENEQYIPKTCHIEVDLRNKLLGMKEKDIFFLKTFALSERNDPKKLL